MADRSLVREGRKALVTARDNARTLAGLVGATWLVHVGNLLTGGALLTWGIHPRTVEGLLGVLFAPFLHASLSHLAVNTVSFVLLGAITLIRGRADFARISAIGVLSSGLGAWLLGGAGTVHVGASGVIFAYLGFLMARGWFERSVQAVVLSLGTIWFFGGMVFGVLPTVGAGISWQAHLFGFLGGILAARSLRARRR